MNEELARHLKPDVKVMLDTLSRQAGRDAVEVGCEWFPEFRDTPVEWKATVFQNIHNIMRVKGEPFTPENAKHAAQLFIANAECDLAAAQEANPTNPPAFIPKSDEVERDFLQNASTEEVGRYLQAKHSHR